MKSNILIEKNIIYDDLFDNTYVAVLVVDINRNILLVNRRFCELFDYEENELIGENVEKLHIDKTHFKKFGEIAFKHVINKKPMSVNFQFKRKDGTIFWAKISGDPLKRKEHVLWTIVDITENYAYQEKLQEQTKLLETVINETPYPIVLKDFNAKFVLVNNATAKLYSSTPEDMIGKDDGDFIPDKDMADFFRRNVQEIMREGKTKIVYEDSIDVQTNEIRNYMSIKKPFKNNNGEDFILVLANDITELNKKNEELSKKEKLLFQQSKMAAMGEMIANIAHQWRQPLSMISASSTGLQLQKELGVLDDKTLDDTLGNINSYSQYLSNTIEDFKNFFKKDSTLLNFSIKEAVEETINLVKMRINEYEIDIIKEFNIDTLYSYKNEFIQVLMNILNNSIDALKEKEDNRLIFIESSLDYEENIIIKIKDNAGGVDSKIIDKIFDPYFTTKHQSQGTGIGLYMSEEIVVKHLNGELYVENSNYTYDNKNYTGAQFIIKIPANSL